MSLRKQGVSNLISSIQGQKLLQGAVNGSQAGRGEGVERCKRAQITLPVSRLLRQQHACLGAPQRRRDRPHRACDDLLWYMHPTFASLRDLQLSSDCVPSSLSVGSGNSTHGLLASPCSAVQMRSLRL